MVASIAAEQTTAERQNRDFPKIIQVVRAELEFRPRSFCITLSCYIITIISVPLAKSTNLSEPCFPHTMSGGYDKDNYLIELLCRLRKCSGKHLMRIGYGASVSMTYLERLI